MRGMKGKEKAGLIVTGYVQYSSTEKRGAKNRNCDDQVLKSVFGEVLSPNDDSTQMI